MSLLSILYGVAAALIFRRFTASPPFADRSIAFSPT